MACNYYVKNGPYNSQTFIRSSRVAYELGIGATHGLQMDFTPELSGSPAVNPPRVSLPPQYPFYNSEQTSHNSNTFMNTMDEISYWIYTKRAPCLMNYDNKIKDQSEAHQITKITKPKSVPSVAKVPSPKKKTKRKLSLLDDTSSSTDKQKHVYFDRSQNVKQTVVSNGKSDSLGSDIDFNLKTFSTPGKRKKLQKNNKGTHKKTKIISSTPKVLPLRRSLRKAQKSLKNNSQFDSSFEVCNTSIINGHKDRHVMVEQTLPDNKNKSNQILASGDQSIYNKKKAAVSSSKPKHNVPNGQFDDFSDVSGFTANYIRSTKLQSTKAGRKSRLQNSKNIVERQHHEQKDATTGVRANKSVNTALKSAAQNCSTDSENVINLVTTKVKKSTPLSKFMESNVHNESSGVRAREPVNISFESKNTTSRYPKRYRNSSKTQDTEIQEKHKTINKEKVKKINNNSDEINTSDRKEISEIAIISKTRSGRNIALPQCPENSVVVLTNSTEQVSSTVSVANPVRQTKERKKKCNTRHSRYMQSQHANVQRDSLREKSGFSACFSDSDNDSEPLKQRKYFCA